MADSPPWALRDQQKSEATASLPQHISPDTISSMVNKLSLNKIPLLLLPQLFQNPRPPAALKNEGSPVEALMPM